MGNKLNNLGIKTYLHYEIKGYPHNVDRIISEEGFGKNEYIKTTRDFLIAYSPQYYLNTLALSQFHIHRFLKLIVPYRQYSAVRFGY